MKIASFLLGGLLAASLCCQGTQAAAMPAKPKERAMKPRAGKVVKTPPPAARQIAAARAGVVIPASIAPQGLALALSPGLGAPPAPARPPAPVAYVPVQGQAFDKPRDNPYLPPPPAPVQAVAVVSAPALPATGPSRPGMGSLLGSMGFSIPLLPDSGQSILPSIKKVYPTGEKPLVVVSFKCPTEVIGVTPPTIKLLHNLVDMGMDGINRTDLLSFNLQQVCQ